MKASAVSTITKSLPIALPVLVNCSLLATLGYFNLFVKKFKNKIAKFDYISMKITGGRPFITTQGQFENSQIPLHLLIDSGSCDAMWLFEKPEDGIKSQHNFIHDNLGIGIFGEVLGKRSRINSIQIGDFTIQEPITSFPDSLSVKTIQRNKRNGSIGNEILRRFTTIFDFQNGLLYLKKNSEFHEDFHFNMAGIELIQPHLNLPYLEIIYVRKNSPAAISGLKAGDIVKEFNGKIIGTFHKDVKNLKSSFKEIFPVSSFQTKKKDRITLSEILEIFNTKEDETIEIIFTRNGNPFEFKSTFKLEKSI